MLHFVQSYVSTQRMGCDDTVYAKLVERFKNLNWIGLIGPKVRLLSKKEMLTLGYRAVMQSKKTDLIFCWNGETALYTWFISKLLFRPRNILGQNLIINPERFKSKATRLRRELYKMALNGHNFHVTVNSPQMVDFYDKIFQCGRDRFNVVYDSMTLIPEEKKYQTLDDKKEFYIFGGGKEERDIECFLRIAKKMPHVKFKGVYLKEQMPAHVEQLPNLEIYNNIPKEQFYDILGNASICLMPLKAETPCGLSVVQKAMLMGVNIVGTNTPSMRSLVPDDTYGFLCNRGDDEHLMAGIQRIIDDEPLRKSMRKKAMDFCIKMFSPEEIAMQICKTIEKYYKG